MVSYLYYHAKLRLVLSLSFSTQEKYTLLFTFGYRGVFRPSAASSTSFALGRKCYIDCITNAMGLKLQLKLLLAASKCYPLCLSIITNLGKGSHMASGKQLLEKL